MAHIQLKGQGGHLHLLRSRWRKMDQWFYCTLSRTAHSPLTYVGEVRSSHGGAFWFFSSDIHFICAFSFPEPWKVYLVYRLVRVPVRVPLCKRTIASFCLRQCTVKRNSYNCLEVARMDFVWKHTKVCLNYTDHNRFYELYWTMYYFFFQF